MPNRPDAFDRLSRPPSRAGKGKVLLWSVVVLMLASGLSAFSLSAFFHQRGTLTRTKGEVAAAMRQLAAANSNMATLTSEVSNLRGQVDALNGQKSGLQAALSVCHRGIEEGVSLERLAVRASDDLTAALNASIVGDYVTANNDIAAANAGTSSLRQAIGNANRDLNRCRSAVTANL